MSIEPISLATRFAVIGCVGAFGCAIFFVATALHKGISKRSERRNIQGQPLRWWVAGLYTAGGTAGALLADNDRYYMMEIVGGMGGFGIVAGVILGNFHGLLNLLRQPKNVHRAETSKQNLLDGTMKTTDNPYEPPRTR